jgi:hypothetical protein
MCIYVGTHKLWHDIIRKQSYSERVGFASILNSERRGSGCCACAGATIAQHCIRLQRQCRQCSPPLRLMIQCWYRNSVLSIYYTALLRRGALITCTNTLPDCGYNSTGRRNSMQVNCTGGGDTLNVSATSLRNAFFGCVLLEGIVAQTRECSSS